MKIENAIRKYTTKEIIAASDIPTGLTNRNIKVTLSDGECVVLRLPRNPELFDYVHEAKVIAAVKKIDIPTLYFDENTGVKISPFIPDAKTYTHDYLESAAMLIRKLHQLKIQSGKSFALKERFAAYYKSCLNPSYDLQPYAYLIDRMNRFIRKNPKILCHNDCVAGNFLFTADKSYLIDYEYAADNHPFFDIMSFITENDIDDEALRERVYQVYFEREITIEERQLLLDFECVHHVLWCAWAMAMFEQEKTAVYEEIAANKYQHLMTALKKTET